MSNARWLSFLVAISRNQGIGNVVSNSEECKEFRILGRVVHCTDTSGMTALHGSVSHWLMGGILYQ